MSLFPDQQKPPQMYTQYFKYLRIYNNYNNNIKEIKKMSQQLGQFSESSKINQEFRKEIRRKDIDRRLAQRRKLWLELQKNNGLSQYVCDPANIGPRLQQLYQGQVYNGGKLGLLGLKQLAKISCSMAGSQAILNLPKQFFQSLLNQFILNEAYDDTPQLDYSLLLLNNSLTVSTPAPTLQPNLTNLSILSLTSSSKFLQRIFTIVLNSSKQSIRQYAISIIFDVIYNNDNNFTHNLIVNSKFAVIGLLYNLMNSEPSKVIVMEVFRCFYLVMKKVGFGAYDQFGRMRKYINVIIKNSNCLQVFLIGVICLQSLLRCLPAQRSLFSKSNTLPTLLSQTLGYSNPRLTIHTIKCLSLLLDNKNQQQSKQILTFLQKCLNKFQQSQIQVYCLKIIYDIIVNNLYQVDAMLVEGQTLFNKILDKFQDDRVDRTVIVEVCFCLAVITAKSRKINKELVDRIRGRIQSILQNWDLNEDTAKQLEQSLQILDANSSMEE